MKKRVTISLDETLMDIIENRAKQSNLNVASYIVEVLEKQHLESKTMYYSDMLELVIKEVELLEPQDFILSNLDSFKRLYNEKPGEATTPAMLTARIGRQFNTLVRKGLVKDVVRAKDDGKLKFYNRAAVYRKVGSEDV